MKKINKRKLAKTLVLIFLITIIIIGIKQLVPKSKVDLGQVFRHTFLRIFINLSNFA